MVYRESLPGVSGTISTWAGLTMVFLMNQEESWASWSKWTEPRAPFQRVDRSWFTAGTAHLTQPHMINSLSWVM